MITPPDKKRIFQIVGLLCMAVLLGPCVRTNLLCYSRYVAPFRVGSIEHLPESQPLIDAIKNDNLIEVRRLLNSGVSSNSVCHTTSDDDSHENRFTALMVAASWGHIEIVKLLLERGADVNVTAFWGQNAVMEAATAGNPQVVRLLIEHGADVNADDDGATALGYVSHTLAATDESAPKTAEERHRYEEVASLLKGAGARQWPLPFGW